MKQLVDDIRELRPTTLCAVPRVLDRIYSGKRYLICWKIGGFDPQSFGYWCIWSFLKKKLFYRSPIYSKQAGALVPSQNPFFGQVHNTEALLIIIRKKKKKKKTAPKI